VVRHAGRILCLWEAGLPTEVTPGLETVGLYDFGGRFAGPMTAHPKIDPATGELLFFGYSVFPPFLRYHVADADGKLARSVDLELPAPVMMHDFVTTAEHAIFLDAPAVFQLEQALRGGPMLAWKPENGARFGVLPRGGDCGDVVWLETEPCYVFHFLNAWSEGSRVWVDGCRLSRMDIGLESEGEMAAVAPQLTRWSLDLARGTCREERLGELPGDFPRVADAVVGRRGRYGYVASFSSGKAAGALFDCVVKYDFERGSERIHRYGEGRVTGEAVFAPDPAGSAEDDGWLLSFVYDLRDHTSEFVIIDARTPEHEAVARVRIPRRVPFGFHGSWLPEAGSAR
jgi:carotenoid cleavage dioxygenase